MLFAGIDVSKFKHDVSVLNSDNEIVLNHFVIDNSFDGFNALKQKFEKMKSTSNSQIIIALEDTGHYDNALVHFLQMDGYEVYSYNPYLIKKFSESLTLRKTKTDKKDALLIARKLFTDYFEGSPLSKPHIQVALKDATRHRSRLTRRHTEAKLQYVRLLDRLFPELASVVNLHNLSTMELLMKYPTPQKIKTARISSLYKIKHLKKSTADSIKNLAHFSIGVDHSFLTTELIQTIQTIQHLQKQIDDTDNHIESLLLETQTTITSIPGIGTRLAAIILSEFRDVNNFRTPAQMASFAGIEPSINQSGTSSSSAKMVKRGSRQLRWALLLAARLVAMNSDTFRRYLLKKMSEGRKYNQAIPHVAKKLVRVIFSLMKNNVPFDESILQ